jgi:hypothetical protein
MALDIINSENGRYIDLPENLQFNVGYEPTRMKDKNYVINQETDEVIGIVGNSFRCSTHQEFTKSFAKPLFAKLSDDDINNMECNISTARNNGFMMLDLNFPTTKTTITTDTMAQNIGLRIVALHGVDGLCSNQVYFGAIDFFCTNKQVTGEHDKVRKKNTSGFSIGGFLREIENMNFDFKRHTAKLQEWASTPLNYVNVRDMLHSLMKSERKGDKMLGLYGREASRRGHNLYALYSAFTNYSTYADEHNGFKDRNTGKDTKAVTMWKREEEVSKWVSSPQFKALANV